MNGVKRVDSGDLNRAFDDRSFGAGRSTRSHHRSALPAGRPTTTRSTENPIWVRDGSIFQGTGRMLRNWDRSIELIGSSIHLGAVVHVYTARRKVVCWRSEPFWKGVVPSISETFLDSGARGITRVGCARRGRMLRRQPATLTSRPVAEKGAPSYERFHRQPSYAHLRSLLELHALFRVSGLANTLQQLRRRERADRPGPGGPGPGGARGAGAVGFLVGFIAIYLSEVRIMASEHPPDGGWHRVNRPVDHVPHPAHQHVRDELRVSLLLPGQQRDRC